MGNKYDDLDKNALDILMDYSEGIFPLNLEHICEKLRIKLIPYSNVSKEKLEEVHAIASNGELKDGCTIILEHPDEDGYIAYTYYNDKVEGGRDNFTIAHEIGHVVDKNTKCDEASERFADHFARMLLAPTCILIKGHYDSAMDIKKKFGLSPTASQNALKAKKNRVRVYGEKLFPYEEEFIEWYLENVKK